MKTALAFLAFLIFLGGNSLAQTGQITGRIVDKISKQPLPGADVTVVGTELGASSDEDGVYVILNVPENVYKLQINYIGYQAFVETDVRVVRNKSAYVEDIELIPTLIEGEAVEVNSRFADENPEAPISNYTYSREELIRAPGAGGDVFRAMEALPGVSTSGGEFAAFSVRGGSPRENVILIDNIPFSKLTHFDGGNNEEEEAQGGRFSIFAPGVIEEANFRGGGFSAEYGGKFSSVLDMKIREGNFETPTVDARYDILGWEVNYNGPTAVLDNTSLFLSARHQDFKTILDVTDQKDLGDPSFTDLIAKTTTRLNGANTLSLLGIYAPEKFQRNRGHVLESLDQAETSLADVSENLWLTGVNLRTLTGKSSFWQNTVYHGFRDQDGEAGQAIPLVANPQSEADLKPRIYQFFKEQLGESGLRSVFTWLPAPGQTLSLGLDVNRKAYDYRLTQEGLDTLYTYDQDDFRPDPDRNYIIRRPQDVNIDFNDEQLYLGSFFQYAFRPLVNLTLNLGMRYEYNQFNEDHYLSPRASLDYLLDDKTRFSLSGGVYYQAPDFSFALANPLNADLKNERAYHLIGGLNRYLRPDLKLTTEVYYKQFEDLIVRPDRTSQQLSNAGEGWAAGVDVVLLKQFVNKFYGQINYSFSQSKRDDRDGEGEYNSDFNQPHIFSILAGYEFSKELSASVKWRYATGRPEDGYIIHADVFNDPGLLRYSKEITGNNSGRLKDFHTLNFRMDYRKQLGRVALVSFVDVVNVYNYTNVNQNRFLPITGKFTEEGFGILPTGGLKIEF